MDVDSSCKAELFHRVSPRHLLVFILCSIAVQVSLSGPRAAAALLRKTRMPDCRRNSTEIVLLALYPPCTKEAHSSSELEKLEQCDLLTEVAIDLAVERINQNPSILPDGATLRVLPIRFEDGGYGVNTPDDKMVMVSHQN